MKQFDIEVWPGFKYQVKMFDEMPVLNIDIDYLAVKLENVLDVIQEIKKESDPKSSTDRIQ